MITAIQHLECRKIITFQKLYEINQSWSKNDLIAAINQGKQFVQHAGHANQTYVAYLSNSDITNSNFSGANGISHNYTFLQTHGCDCGAFDYNDCILEKMVTIQNFAAAVIGNSRYGWFNEGQTEGPAIHLQREMVDAMFHEKLNRLGAAFVEAKIQTAPWVTAPGQWEEGALRWNFYDINILGDPALAVFTDEPISIQTTYQNTLPLGVPSTSVTVMSEGSPMEDFRCAIFMDGILQGVGITDATGTAQIEFDPGFTTVGDAQLIVSGYNCLPTTYPITIVPNAGSYVIYSACEVNDSQGNSNGQLDFGETAELTIEIENVGSQNATDVQVTLSTLDEFVTILDGGENYGTVASGANVSIPDGFEIQVANNIPDQHVITFDLEIIGGDTWNSSFNLVANAPELEIGNLSIDDSEAGNGDGILDPGEMADIIVQASNSGHSSCANTQGLITSGSDLINIATGNFNFGTINTGETKDATFTIVVDGSAPLGTSVDLNFEMASGEYSVQNTFYLTIGMVNEDFETGDFSKFDWQQSGNQPWIVTNVDPYEGDYSAKSGAISDNQSSSMFVTMNVLSDDQISFYKKVSSESDYDYLEFYIDGVQMDEWSGEEAWSQVSYAVTAGNHTFKWTYSKDVSVLNGSDCAWIDYIVFPAASGSGNILNVAASASPSELCAGESSQLNAFASGGSGNYTYQWTPGTGLNNAAVQNPVATPSVTTTYSVVVSDGSAQVNGSTTVTVHPVPATPVITLETNHLVSSATSGNQWYGSNGAIAGATGQNFYPTTTDSYYTIVSNEFGCESEQSNTLYFVYTAISEQQDQTVSIYPNPVKDHLMVEYNLQSEAKVSIKLYDKLGRQAAIIAPETLQHAGFYQLDFSMPDLRTGIYMIRIESSLFCVTKKLLLTK